MSCSWLSPISLVIFIIQVCKNVNNNFKNSNFSSHMKYCHSEERHFGPCKFCDKMFKSRCDYKKHLQTHFKPVEPFKCDAAGCYFQSKTQSSMDYHKRMMHACGNTIVSKGYKCHFCYKE